MSDQGQLTEVAAEVRRLAEELADLALTRLRSAAAGDDADVAAATADERRITRARRSLEKAAALLDDHPADPFV